MRLVHRDVYHLQSLHSLSHITDKRAASDSRLFEIAQAVCVCNLLHIIFLNNQFTGLPQTGERHGMRLQFKHN